MDGLSDGLVATRPVRGGDRMDGLTDGLVATSPSRPPAVDAGVGLTARGVVRLTEYEP